MSLEAIKYSNGKLSILDQLLLPFESKYIPICSVDDAYSAIKNMQVRGAPAIAIVGCLSLAVELLCISPKTFARKDIAEFISTRMKHLVNARPTAVNISKAAEQINALVQQLDQHEELTLQQMIDKIVSELERMLESDVNDNKAIGQHGAQHIKNNCTQRPLRILTHCNTGSLATAGYGTALGVIRSLHASGDVDHVFCTETRPYNQGARLTAYELVHDAIPSTMICDSMVGWTMRNKQISAVVVGADRVAANGDTANKIGTYQHFKKVVTINEIMVRWITPLANLPKSNCRNAAFSFKYDVNAMFINQLAVLSSHHLVPFYVAAPLSSVDWNVASGDLIAVEERPQTEMTHISCHRVAADGINCWNPAFDITPANLITGGIVTEKGVSSPQQLQQFL